MKKHLAALIVCAFALCLALVGCGGGGGGQDYTKIFVGIWEAESMESEGEVVSGDDMALMRSLGMNVTLSLTEDKKCEMNLMGEVMSGTWEAKDATTASITIDGDTADCKLADKKLTFEIEGMKLVFALNNDAKVSSSGEGGTSALDGDGMTNEGEEATTPINQVIADDAVCTIEVVSSGVDWAGDPGYNLKITNKSDKAIYVSNEYGTFSVNGKMVDPSLGETVQPGKYVETFMYFGQDDLGGGAEKLVAVEGTISAVDDSSYDEMGLYSFKL